jgi:CRISP-associated protein Cas1
MSARPLRSREPLAYVEHCTLKIQEGRLVADSAQSGATPVPVENLVALLVGPGCNVTSDAVSLAARTQTALVHVGEHGIRFYSAGRPFGADGDVAEQHALRWSNEPEAARRLLFAKRWERVPIGTTAAEIRGEEGALVRSLYRSLAAGHGVTWSGRRRSDFSGDNPINDALSWGGMSVGAMAAAVVHAVGAIPALGFIHSGGAFSFVYDVADLIRNDVIRLVFRLAEEERLEARDVRLACRGQFREAGTAQQLFADILEVIGVGEK